MKAIDILFEEKVQKISSPEFKAIVSSNAVKTLGDAFEKSGFDLRIVGGAVRDLMLGRQPKDIDFATDAKPEQMIKMFQANSIRYIETGLQHGTITAVIDSEPLEITTLRKDVTTDGRHAEVSFDGVTWEEDAERRDLTYNAMSLDLNGRLYDYHGGMKDLRANKSMFVGRADKRIQEDYLRILRYFRFQGRQPNPNWDKKTMEAIRRNAHGLKTISGERIWAEMGKILIGNHVKEILTKMGELNVNDYIHLPLYDIDTADKVSIAKNPIVPLAALIQDTEEDLIVKQLNEKWKFSKAERELLLFLVDNKDEKLTSEELEGLAADGINKFALHSLAMIQGTNTDILSWVVPPFPVTGRDLLAKSIPPGPQLGAYLSQLKDIWKSQKFKPNREQLLAYIDAQGVVNKEK